MGKLKGCTNEECVSCQKKKKYKEKDSFCINCGGILICLCKKCRTVLPCDAEGDLCEQCAQKAQEKSEKLLRIAKKTLLVGGSVAVVLKTAFPKLLQISSISAKLKKKK